MIGRMSPADRRTDRPALTLVVMSIVLGLLAARFDTFPGDRALAEAARGLGEPWSAIARVANGVHMPLMAASVTIAVAVAAWRRRGDALAVIAIAGAGRVLLQLPRILIDRPRPSGDVVVRAVASGASFPSGHVMTAMLGLGLWFVLAPVLVPERSVSPVRALCALGVAAAMFARVWAGVHWPSDTAGGVLWMAAVLAVGVVAAGRRRPRSARGPQP